MHVCRGALLKEAHILHVVGGSLHLRDIVATVVHLLHVLECVAVRHILLAGVGGAGEHDGCVVQPQAVGTLNGLEGLGGVALRHAAEVAHLYVAVYIATEHRGAAAEERAHDDHLGVGGYEVVGGVVVLTVYIGTALAAHEAGVVEGHLAAGVTPVSTAVDRVHERQAAGCQRIAVAVLVAGLEHDVGAVFGVVAVFVAPHSAAVDGVHTDVDIRRAVDDTLIAGAVHVRADGTAGEVHYRRGAHGGHSHTVGAGGVGTCGGLTLGRVAVVDELRAAIEALVYLAAVHVDDLQAVDDGRLGLLVAAAAAEDVAVELTAVDVQHYVGEVFGVADCRGFGARSVGHIAYHVVVGQTGGIDDILAGSALLVGEHSAELAAAVEAAVDLAVVEGDMYVLRVGALDAVAAGIGCGRGVHVCEFARQGIGVLSVVVAVRIVAVAAAVDVVEVTVVDHHLGAVDVAGEVVAAVEVVHQRVAVELQVGCAADIRAPAAAIDGEERVVPGGVGLDVGVCHIAAATAAVGRGRGDVLGVVQVHIGRAVDVAPTVAVKVAGVEVVPAAFTAAVERAVDDSVAGADAVGRAAYHVVDHQAGGAAVGHRAAGVHRGVDGAAPDVDVGAVDVGLGSRGYQTCLGMCLVVGAVVVHVVKLMAHRHEVIAAVRTAPDALYRAAGHIYTGVTLDLAADVVAAIEVPDTVVGGLADVHIGHAFKVAHAAAAEDGVGDRHVVALGEHIGRYVGHLVAADVEERLFLGHVAAVAAAVDVLHIALHQLYAGHGVHIAEVVAAEDGANVVVRTTAGEAAGQRGGIGGVAQPCVVEQYGHLVGHRAAGAAAEDGVYEAAAGVQVDEGAGLVGSATGILRAHIHPGELRMVAVVVPGTVTRAVDRVDDRRALDEHIGRVSRVVLLDAVHRGGVEVQRVAVRGELVGFAQALGLQLLALGYVAVDVGHAVFLCGRDGGAAAIDVVEVISVV